MYQSCPSRQIFHVSIIATIFDFGSSSWEGGANCEIPNSNALRLSGEPIASQVSHRYGKEPFEQANATQISANNVAKREYQKAYMEYWNGTAAVSSSSRPVDAVIMPVAPFAAARENRYKYYGYTSIFNTLDYTSWYASVASFPSSILGSTRSNSLPKAPFESFQPL